MAVEVLVTTQRNGFSEGPAGYLTLPSDMVESPTGSGLYTIPTYLVESPSASGLYLVPAVDTIDYFAGNRSNLFTYSVVEDASPIDPGSQQGGAGQITVQFSEADDTRQLIQEVVVLSDDFENRGQTQGTIRNIQGADGAATAVMDSALALFNADHIVPPKTGRFDDVIRSYARIVGIVNTLSFDPSIANHQVTYPGWNGNVWDRLKQIQSREQVEFVLIGSTVLVRPIRTITANVEKDIARSFTLDSQNTARKVEVAYFNNTWGTRQEVYPLLDQEPAIYTVDAGEVINVEVRLNASLTSVNQPTCVAFVEDRPYPSTVGVYSVAGNDGLPITPSQWTAQGGYVRVSIGDDPSILKIEIKGATMTEYAPYRIAMTSGSANYYNSLHITGTGVTWNRKTVVIPTGATTAVTGEDIGVTVENPFVSTRSEAYDLGRKTARRYAGTNTINGTSTSVRPVNNEDQVFGNTAGARMQRGNAMYRITQATHSPESVQYAAEQDTLISDVNTAWDGATIADVNIQWNGRLVKDFNTEPLRRD